jgi:hypothetical protein
MYIINYDSQTMHQRKKERRKEGRKERKKREISNFTLH